MNKEKPKINKEAKDYILGYLDEWIVKIKKDAGEKRIPFRIGIVRAIYNFVDNIEVEIEKD